MSEAKFAVVRPRVISPTTGETLLLEDEVGDPANLMRQAPSEGVHSADSASFFRPIQIVGGPGSGKSTALAHLRALLESKNLAAAGVDVVFLDEPERIDHDVGTTLVIFTARQPLAQSDAWLTLRLAPWEEDDLLEYLLARHRTRCGPILTALRQAGDGPRLGGSPELWTLTLDYLAESLPELQAMVAAEFATPDQTSQVSALAALHAAFLRGIGTPRLVDLARAYCLRMVLDLNTEQSLLVLWTEGLEPERLRLLRHGPLCEVLAADQIARDLTSGSGCLYLEKRLPRDIVRLTAEQLRGSSDALAHVRSFLTRPEAAQQPMAASICHVLDRRWLCGFPATQDMKLPNMTGAYLDHADWPGLDLKGAQISMADLSFADLSGVDLEGADGMLASFHGAVLARAKLREFKGHEANLTQADLRHVKAVSSRFVQASFRKARLDEATFYHADLSGADFSGASLVKVGFRQAGIEQVKFAEADCTEADFTEAKLEGADLRTARLDGTCWRRAHLSGCNFEDVEAIGVDFEGAFLTGALLTASSLPGANFGSATLVNTGLAEIDWEGANLRDADLRGASFHLGSSRSGMVGSPIAREGSMTGFYTDEYTEQSFKSPEEIRKANLRGADLRGANVEGVDFYLVDLRDALYDAEQARHFRACRAILEAGEQET